MTEPDATAPTPTSTPTAPSSAASASVRVWRWLRWLRRLVNVFAALLIGSSLVLLSIPRVELEQDSRMQVAHDQLVEKLRKVSISQTWKMYAPDPARGHYYMELKAYDADGNERLLEESVNAQTGWGTTWAWKRTRVDIWHHSVGRRIDKVNRNRTWYMRGVCMREARRGYEVQRLELTRVYRRIRRPEQVREGKALLGKAQRRKGQDSSCRVKIIRDMIARDRELHPERYPAEGRP